MQSYILALTFMTLAVAIQKRLRQNSMPYTVYYDNDCGMCSSAIRLLVRISKNDSVQTKALNSIEGQQFVLKHSLVDVDSVIVSDGEQIFLKSTAILKLCSISRFPWNLFVVFYTVPEKFRDLVYDWVARNRKRGACQL